MIKRDAEFERAVRIEMLRAQAAVERHEIASKTSHLADSLDPRTVVGRWLPGSAQDVLSRSMSLVSRYPHVLAALFTNRKFKAVRWLSLIAVGIGAWSIFSGGQTNGSPDDSA